MKNIKMCHLNYQGYLYVINPNKMRKTRNICPANMSYDALNEVRFEISAIKNKKRKYESFTLYHVIRSDALNEAILNKFGMCFVLKQKLK